MRSGQISSRPHTGSKSPKGSFLEGIFFLISGWWNIIIWLASCNVIESSFFDGVEFEVRVIHKFHTLGYGYVKPTGWFLLSSQMKSSQEWEWWKCIHCCDYSMNSRQIIISTAMFWYTYDALRGYVCVDRQKDIETGRQWKGKVNETLFLLVIMTTTMTLTTMIMMMKRVIVQHSNQQIFQILVKGGIGIISSHTWQLFFHLYTRYSPLPSFEGYIMPTT